MSKSYRKPYSSWCGVRSSAYDKMLAARGVRRAQDQVLRDSIAHDADWDEVLMPLPYECSHNDVWVWNRDGNKYFCHASTNTFNPYAHCSRRYGFAPADEFAWLEEAERDHALWMARMSRK